MYGGWRVMQQSTIVVERPSEGPAQGRWEAAPWMIIALVVVALFGAGGYWLVRLRRTRASEKPSFKEF